MFGTIIIRGVSIVSARIEEKEERQFSSANHDWFDNILWNFGAINSICPTAFFRLIAAAAIRKA